MAEYREKLPEIHEQGFKTLSKRACAIDKITCVKKQGDCVIDFIGSVTEHTASVLEKSGSVKEQLVRVKENSICVILQVIIV